MEFNKTLVFSFMRQILLGENKSLTQLISQLTKGITLEDFISLESRVDQLNLRKNNSTRQCEAPNILYIGDFILLLFHVILWKKKNVCLHNIYFMKHTRILSIT